MNLATKKLRKVLIELGLEPRLVEVKEAGVETDGFLVVTNQAPTIAELSRRMRGHSLGFLAHAVSDEVWIFYVRP